MWFRITLALRWLVLVAALCAPPALLGYLAAGVWGAAVGTVAGFGVVFILSMISEQVIFRLHEASEEIPQGLTRSLKQVLLSERRNEASAPDIFVFPDPGPMALVARNPGSSGLILVSQGAVATLGERDLRELLLTSTQRSDQPWVPVATVAGVLALGLARAVPDGWLRVLQPQGAAAETDGDRGGLRLRVLPALGLLTVFPLIRFVLSVGGARTLPLRDSSRIAQGRGPRPWMRFRHPALSHLYLTP
jgi:hypothetical protein